MYYFLFQWEVKFYPYLQLSLALKDISELEMNV